MFRLAASRSTRQAALRPFSSIRPQISRPQPPGTQLRQRRGVSNFRRGVESFLIGAKYQFKQSPLGMTGAFVMFAGILACGAAVFRYYYYTVGPINTTYPEEVANKLRRALWYSSIDVQPDKALKYYKQALDLAQERGLHGFSDEVLGIKLRVAHFFESIHAYAQAIGTLEQIRADCLRWLEVLGGDDGDGTGSATATAAVPAEHRADRARILRHAIRVDVKLGELCSSEYVGDLEAAERYLMEGVEANLRELQRRREQGSAADEGEWLGAEEIGASMERLAEHYEAKSRFGLAAPLFLRALTLDPPPCHAVVLMNNLASCLAQTSPEQAAASAAGGEGGAPTSRSVLIASARSWAERALAVAAGVKPPERTGECDVGCATATHNLAEFAEMEGLLEEARQKYVEASSLAKAIGFGEGVQQAQEGLRRLKEAKGN